jgi:tripartite-type tricarboxylate transporter receptor subunit TctC
MMITRRTVLSAIAGAMAAGPALPQGAYPDRLIKMIVPAPAGGQTDVLARLLAQKIQAAVGQTVIVENRAGAGGTLGARALAAAEPDGYTLFYGNTSTLAVIPAVTKNPGYDPVKNFAPIASVSESYMILVVNPDFPVKSVAEFVAYAKANPGKLNFGHAGYGNVTHLTGEMFRSLANIDFLGVPHKGGAESITSLLGQQIDFVFESPVVLLPLIRDGKLRAYGVTTSYRIAALPEVPAIGEVVGDYDAIGWYGLGAPSGTPAEIIKKLSEAMNAALDQPKVKESFVQLGVEPMPLTPEGFRQHIAVEAEKWGKVIRMQGITMN